MSSIQGGGEAMKRATALTQQIGDYKKTQTPERQEALGKMQGRIILAVKSKNAAQITKTVNAVASEYLEMKQPGPAPKAATPKDFAPSEQGSSHDPVAATTNPGFLRRARELDTREAKFDQKGYDAAVKHSKGLGRRNRGVETKGSAAARLVEARGRREDRTAEREGSGIGDRLAHFRGDVAAAVGDVAAGAFHEIAQRRYG